MFKSYYQYSIFSLLLVSPTLKAEVYKWVDDKGRTHYSDTKQYTGNLKVEALIVPELNVIRVKAAKALQLSEQNNSAATPIKKKQNKKHTAGSLKVSWGGQGPETDVKRCALARSILKGTAKHTNGTPIDSYDLKVARRDIRKFCH